MEAEKNENKTPELNVKGLLNILKNAEELWVRLDAARCLGIVQVRDSSTLSAKLQGILEWAAQSHGDEIVREHAAEFLKNIDKTSFVNTEASQHKQFFNTQDPIFGRTSVRCAEHLSRHGTFSASSSSVSPSGIRLESPSASSSSSGTSSSSSSSVSTDSSTSSDANKKETGLSKW